MNANHVWQSSCMPRTGPCPQTFCNRNDWHGCLQAIVDAYGIARYREINPAIFTIVTFPFLFAVMFGDIGHGFLMLLLCIYLIANEKKMMKQDLGDMVDMIFGGADCLHTLRSAPASLGTACNALLADCLVKLESSGFIACRAEGTAAGPESSTA